MGVNQSTVGVHKNNAINQFASGHRQDWQAWLRPVFLTGQPNAMGGREVGGLSHMLPGYRSVRESAQRGAVERSGAGHPVPSRPSPACRRWSSSKRWRRENKSDLDSLHQSGRVGAGLDLIEKALRQAELVVVQDAYHPTATSRLAHVILPAAQWSEKEGVMTNSERRVTYMPKLVEPPGEALPDWQDHRALLRRRWGLARTSITIGARNFCRVRGLTENTLRLFGHELCKLKASPLQWPYPKRRP